MRNGYRIDAPRPKPKRRTLQKTSTRGTVYVADGTTASLAIPCYYMEMHRPIPAAPHDRMRHDMLGWPTPDKPDSCCQEWDFVNSCCRRTPHMECCPPHCEHFIDMRRLFPIHLKDEGYTSFEVEIVDAPEGLVATASLDPDDDWIVRVSIESDIGAKSFSDAMITRRFSVFAKTGTNKRDLVFNGTIVVTPTAHLGTRRE